MNDGATQTQAPEAVAELLGRARRSRLECDVPGYEAAVPLLRSAIELDPACAPAYAELAETYSYWGFRREIAGQESQSLYDMALDFAETALRLDGALAQAHRALSVALRRGSRADPERRRREIDRAVELAPDDPETLCELWRVEGYDPDDPRLARVLERAPGLVAAHIDRGAALCELDRLDEALAELVKALELRPGNVQVYYDIAMVLDRTGQRAKAREILRRAGRVRPGDSLIEQGLSFLEGA